MSVAIIKSWKVEKHNDVFIIHIGYKHYDLGFQIHTWGIRLMLIWWHVCIHFEPVKIDVAKYFIKQEDCSHCRGTGEDGHDRCHPPNPYICEKCDGSGKIKKN